MKKRSRQRLSKNDSSPLATTLLNHAENYIASHRQQHPMEQLQQTIGNRAVVRQLQKKNEVQRETETGIADASARRGFVTDVRDWRTDHLNYNPPVPAYVFIDEVARKAQDVLTNMGIPAPTKILDPAAPGSLQGQFRAKEWSLLLNPNMGGPIETTIDTLSNERLLQIVGVIYHEIRHCEQYYNMARFLAGTGVEASEIARTMDIPETVAQSAHSKPLTLIVTDGIPFLGGGLPSISQEFIDAWQWYRQVYGKLGDYTQGIYDILKDIWTLRANLDGFLLDTTNAGLAYNMDVVVQLWKDERIPNVLQAYKTSLEASQFKFQMDEQSLTHINEILPAMRNFIDLWDQSPEDFADLKPKLDSVNEAVKKAYEALYTEKDAHVLGDKVTENFKLLAGI